MIKIQNNKNHTPSRVLAGYWDNHIGRTAEQNEPGQNKFGAVNFTPNEVSKVLLIRISLDEIRAKPFTINEVL